jgi:hypothetical protein
VKKRRARMAVLVGFMLAIACALQVSAPGSFRMLTAVIAAAVSPLPSYLAETADLEAQTRLIRITKPGALGSGVVCSAKWCSHRYSSSQAWNSNQTMVLLANGCKGLCFLDGQSYRPLFHRAQWRECEWHPRLAEAMICVGERDIRLWAPRTGRVAILFDSASYRDLQFGPGKGNPSLDGNRIAVRAVRKSGQMVVFAYDIASRQKFPDIDFSARSGKPGSCSISPLGGLIHCLQSLNDGTLQTDIFDVNGKLVQRWLENHRPGHGDMALDADGSEVYVGISKSPPDLYQVVKRRLTDGAVTPLLPYGEASHVSMRATGRRGWAIVTYEGNPSEVAMHQNWAPYARQVIAVALNGSGEVRILANTNNDSVTYEAEAHGAPSPDGSKIIWSSNWGAAGGPVHEFVSKVDWPS